MKSAENIAYDSIVNDILSGKYRPGDFLLESDIAPKLKMSRTPVSKALSKLVAVGFLSKLPKRGCYIPIPTPEDAEEVFTAREYIEGEAAALAAKYVTNDDIIYLEHLLEKDNVAFENNEKQRWAVINERFHLYIAKMAHNVYIERWVKSILWKSNVYIFYFDNFYKPTDIIIEPMAIIIHKEILSAIKNGDQNQARKLMQKHINYTFSNLLINSTYRD